MKQLYALLVCITIACVNSVLYAMDDTSNNRNTAVLDALKKNKPCEHIKNLLDQGADPNGIQGDLQNNPLAYLLDCFGTENKYAIAKLLLEHGADPNALPYIAITAAKRDSEMVDLLLNNGMKLDAYESVGDKGTPLTEAIAHLKGYACLERVLKLIKAGAPVQDGCALLEAAAQGSEEMVGVLFAHKCSPDAWVKQYYSNKGAMDCTRDEGNAYDLYREFCKGWHPGSLPCKYKRITAMFEKAQTNPESFVYCPDVMDIFEAAPQFPVMKTDRCVCRVIDPENLQHPEDQKIVRELVCPLQGIENKDYELREQYLISTILPAMKNMKDDQVRVCLMYVMFSKGFFKSRNQRDQFCALLCEQPEVAFSSHKSLKADRDTDILVRIISKAHKKKSERGEYKVLFEKLLAHKPQDWKSSWCHIYAALTLAQEDVPYYLEALLPHCNINAYGPNGQTLLHALLTSEKVHTGIAKMLLDAGANPNLPDMSYGGNTALQLVLKKSHWDFINEYNDGEGSGNENSDDESAYVSPQEIKRELIKLLIARNADLKQHNVYGETPQGRMHEYVAKLEIHRLAIDVLSELTQQLQLSENSAQEE